MNLNKVFLLGRLTADPQLRTTTNGTQVGTFSVATNRVWNDKISGRREEVEFHNIVVWGQQADVASRFLTKGNLVLIEGRIQTRTWEDQQGQKRKTTEIVSERLQLPPRSMSPNSAAPYNSPYNPPVQPQINKPAPSAPASDLPTVDIGDMVDVAEEEGIKKEDLPF